MANHFFKVERKEIQQVKNAKRNNRRSQFLAGPGEIKSKGDHAYDFVRQKIIDGIAVPGERLIIDSLAREMSISVVPVREAIRRLEAEGYVTFTRNIGATVSSINLDRYPETVEAVAVIEGVAIGLAAAHLTKKDIAKARDLNNQMIKHIENNELGEFSIANKKFHEILYSRCPNRHILSMVVKEWELLETTRRGSTFSYIPARTSGSVFEHEELLRMIESGVSSSEIENFARNHRMATVRSLLRHLGSAMTMEQNNESEVIA